MNPDELGSALERIAGASNNGLSLDETQARARQISRRRSATRTVVRSMAAFGVVAGAVVFANSLDRGDSVALDTSGSEFAQRPLTPSADAMIEAVRADDLAAIESLLDGGADIDAAGRFGYTPIMVAAIRGNAETVDLLAERGADLGLVSSSGHTALHLAARNGHREAIVTLVANGSPLEASTENRYGSTALMIAVSHDQRDAMDALIDAGADLGATDVSGRPLIHYALDTLDVSPTDETARELVATLIDEGATLVSPEGEPFDLQGSTLDETMEFLISTNSPRQS